MRKQRDHQQQGGRAQKDADDIIEAVRLRWWSFFASHAAKSKAARFAFKGKVMEEIKRKPGTFWPAQALMAVRCVNRTRILTIIEIRNK
jgi:hypothetical protein